jgi:hypothetical protein
MEYVARVKYPQPAKTPSVGPQAPREVAAHVASLAISDGGDRGTTTLGLIVQAEDAAGAQLEARRLADVLALQFSLTAEPTIEVAAP